MANVSGVSSSNVSSLYGNKNIISGLASGMDTEAMIENSVSGIRTKINSLLQKQTKLSWQQDAYRSITDQIVQLSRKYTSFTSATNLMSASFFNKAVQVTANGANASKVTASGKTSSNVVIDGVAQLATASRYQVGKGGVLDTVLTNPDKSRYIEGDTALNLNDPTDSSNLTGSMIITFEGKQKLDLKFDSTVYNSVDEFAQAIRDKLGDQTLTVGGKSEKASDVIDVQVADGKISLVNKSGDGSTVAITGLYGKLNETAGKPNLGDKDNPVSSIDLKDKPLKTTTTALEQMAGKTISFTLDGVTKKITLPGADELKTMTSDGTDQAAFVSYLDGKLNDAFGAGKVGASLSADGKLIFSTKKQGSNLSVSSEVGKTLGMENTENTYLSTGKTLSDLLGVMRPAIGDVEFMGGMAGRLLKSEKAIVQKDGSFLDEKGNVVDSDGFRLGKDGKKLYGYDMTINGKTIGTYTRDTALETVMVDINANTEAGVSVSYSKTTNQFVFNAKETGANHDITIGSDLAKVIFGEQVKTDGTNIDGLTKGKDAMVKMTVNGSEVIATRSTNTFDVDGLTVTLNGTFNGSVNAAGEPAYTDATESVSFTTKTDTNKVVDAIKGFVEDFNTMIKAVREAYATVPAQKSDGTRYPPLTDQDMEGWSESTIKNYEEKAKQGLLFADSDLSSLYSKLASAISPAGTDGSALRAMGISTDYSDGITTIKLDEEALRTALDTNPDSVRDAFTKVAGEGSTTNGLMQTLKKTMDTYASTEGGKGILITKAGSKYSAMSLMNNSIKTQMETYDTQITKWQDKLSDKVDYYTRQFSRLEQLISQMNNQSSSLMQMMGTG